MTRRTALRSLTLAGLPLAGLAAADTEGGYRAEIERWREQRAKSLQADGGWLTVTGLFWLKEGDNVLGSAPASDILLPPSAPPVVGTIHVANGAARFRTAAAVTLNGKPVQDADLHYAPQSDTLTAGPLDLLLLKRGERLAIRLKDKNSALRKAFTHLSWYPVQPEWRITGKFVALPTPAKLVLDNIIGDQETTQSPGHVEFERGGAKYKLQAIGQGRRLFFVIRDQTSGKTTYGASRFLYADGPDADGNVVLDFNKAENPPCAFTPYATCPLPPPQNRLSLAVEAGEQKYEGSAH